MQSGIIQIEFGSVLFYDATEKTALSLSQNRQHHILRHVLLINIDSTEHSCCHITGNIAFFGESIPPEILRQKKSFSRRNTLCISRGNGAFLAEKIGGRPKPHGWDVAATKDGRVEICGLRVRRTGSCLRNEKSLLLPCRFSHPAAAYRSSSSMWLRFARYRRYFLWKTVFSPPPIGAAP